MTAWSPQGPFAVGISEVEWTSDEQPLVGRLHYPAPPALKAAVEPAGGWLTPWRWFSGGVPWLLHQEYARGLGTFITFRMPSSRLNRAIKEFIIAVSTLVGKSQRINVHPGAPLAPDAPAELPLVIFSHGLGCNRFLYTWVCAELASQGYLVLAVEHCDGSASCAKLPGDAGWLLYRGLGDEDAQVAKTRVRVAEMKAALQLMQALHAGKPEPGQALSYGLDAATFLRGRVDLRCVAAAGHSYGGATTMALVAEDPRFRCGATLDPWYYALPPESKALERWQTDVPLLVLGSHDWNVPNALGLLSCGGERQEQVLAAAAVRTNGDGQRSGGGAMHLCIAGTSHNSYADALPMFSRQTGWLLGWLGLTARLDPVLGVNLSVTAVLQFLSLHLPLSPAQRSAQSWEPGKAHSLLDRIQERDVADARGAAEAPEAGGTLSSWFFPVRRLLLAASDYVIDRMLPRSPVAFRPVQPMPAAGSAPAAAVPAAAANGAAEPSDFGTGVEAAEAVLPSAEPASGLHPHAPSRTVSGPRLSGGLEPPPAGLAAPLSKKRVAALRAGMNQRYSGVVEAGEAEEMHALLGSHHIFKCRVVA